ncbi:C39 family peptidase [Lacrimispora xylanolytica]
MNSEMYLIIKKGCDTVERNSGIYSHMDCFLMTMELVYTSMNLDFKTMFVNAWRFDYNPDNKNLAVYSYEEYMKMLNSGYLEVSRKQIPKKDVTVEKLKKYIDKYQTVVMTIDCLCCPWHRGYHVASIWHACALTGYTEEGILCTDPFIKGYETFLVPEYVFEYGDFYYYTFAADPQDMNMDGLMKYIISKEDSIMEGIKMIQVFDEDIRKTEKCSDLFDIPEDIYLCTITNGLKAISDYRYQLAFLLEGLYSKRKKEDEKRKEIYTLLYHTSDIWLKVQHMIVRLFYEPRRLEKTKEKISNHIMSIIDIEKKILSEMKECVNECNSY